jgi:hypothetical protein
MIQAIEDWAKTQDLFTVKSVTEVNHQPHQYMIGPKHITHAGDKHGGMLGLETLRAVRCAVPHCQLSYDEHKFDRVLFLQLRRHATNEEASKLLKDLAPTLEQNHIDGVSFVETPEKFRFS